MTFLTSLQLRVLKTSLIPALITWVLTDYCSLPAPVNTFVIVGIFFLWEFIIQKEWKNTAIAGGVIIAFFGLQYLLNVYLIGKVFIEDYLKNNHEGLLNLNNWIFITHLNMFIAYLMVIVTRFHLKGTEKKYAAGILAAFIFYLLPKTGNPFSSGPLHFIIYLFLQNWCNIIFYYVLVFLIENGFSNKNILEKLYSKIQVLNKWEYLFIWIAISFIWLGCVGDLNTRIEVMFAKDSMNGEPVLISGVFMLACVLFLYAGTLMMRNISTSRALTTGKYNPWLLLLHLIPGVNIIAVAVYFFLKEREGTVVDNGLDYTNADRGLAKKVMIAIGIIITVYNICSMLVVPTGLRLVGISILLIVYLLKIVAYIRLPYNKIFVYIVAGFNILTIAYSIDDRFIIYLSLIYLYYYFLIELFYPELEPEDIMEVKNVQGI